MTGCLACARPKMTFGEVFGAATGVSAPSYKNTRIPHPKPPTRRPSRHCSWGRWPRFPPLASRPHPSTTDPKLLLRIRSPAQKNVRRDVRRSTRRDRRFRYLFNDRAAPGSATPATENPNPKPPSRRPSRHCSWARWSRLSHLAFGPHLSKHGSETTSSHPVTCSKKSFGETFGEAHAATVDSGIFSTTGRLRGQRPQRQKIRIRNHHPGGQAATVAGHVGPGFHTWPSGHILQTPDPKLLERICF
jgi:hypothetical protein